MKQTKKKNSIVVAFITSLKFINGFENIQHLQYNNIQTRILL